MATVFPIYGGSSGAFLTITGFVYNQSAPTGHPGISNITWKRLRRCHACADKLCISYSQAAAKPTVHHVKEFFPMPCFVCGVNTALTTPQPQRVPQSRHT